MDMFGVFGHRMPLRVRMRFPCAGFIAISPSGKGSKRFRWIAVAWYVRLRDRPAKASRQKSDPETRTRRFLCWRLVIDFPVMSHP